MLSELPKQLLFNSTLYLMRAPTSDWVLAEVYFVCQ